MFTRSLVLVASALLIVSPLQVLSQTHQSTNLNGSSELRLIGSVIGMTSRFDAVGQTSDRRPVVRSWLQSATPRATPLSPQCLDGENLISNGGFESGEEGWYVDGPVEVTTSNTHSDSTAIRLGSREAAGYMDQLIPLSAPGTTYQLSAWGKLSADGETAQIGIVFWGSNEDRLRNEEPTPLTFSSPEFVQQRLTFTVPSHVAEISVFVYKDDGSAQFYADSLSLTACQAPDKQAATPAAIPAAVTPTIAVSEEQTATPVPGSIAASTSTPPEQDATPTTAGIGPLIEYVDPNANFSIGYPADWRRLTEAEIRSQLGGADERAVEAALANTRFVVVSPDGLATILYTRLPNRQGPESLDEVVQAVKEANAASIIGIGAITTEPLSLHGVDAVRLSFSADDPATGAVGKRLVRQVVTIHDDSTIVLTVILQADAAPTFEETLRQIEERWQWRPQS